MIRPDVIQTILQVGDFDAHRDFYTRVVGLAEVHAWPARNDEPAGAILSAGEHARLELFGPFPSGEITSNVAFSLRVPDADAKHAALLADGVPIARGLVDNPWGDRSFGIDDPDGRRVWFYALIDG